MIWDRGRYNARLWANFTDGYFDDDQRTGVPAGRQIGSWTVLNASFGFDISEDTWITLTLKNIADRDPPIALGSAANFDQYSHDSLGRFYSLSYQQRF